MHLASHRVSESEFSWRTYEAQTALCPGSLLLGCRELLEEDGTITMPRGSEAASIQEATYLKSTHSGGFTSLLSPCQRFGSCLEGCLGTAGALREAGRETDSLTDRQGHVSGQVSVGTSPLRHMHNVDISSWCVPFIMF